jgi:4-hydroxy-tetrahydrodipicolinate synthase
MYLTRAERRRAVEAAVDEAGATPVIAGIGALRTEDTIAHARDARQAGARAGLLAAVSYTPLTDNEVFAHFSAVAGESGLPLIIYDNPSTTHFRFTPELVGRLSHLPGIVAVKNPAGSPEDTARHLADQRVRTPQGFAIGYSGDWNVTEALILGADTWYSVLAGLLPRPCLAIADAVARGDAAEARRLNATLEPVWDLFRTYSSLRVIHVLADLLGICTTEPPRPILPLDDAAARKIAAVVTALPEAVTG